MLLALGSLDVLPLRDRATVIASLVEALVTANRLYIERVGAPELYASGVRYVEGASWKDIPACLRDLVADCKALVAWRVAELRRAGEQAYVRVEHFAMPAGDRLHLVVVRESGEVEDPSRRLGMA